MTDAWLLEDQAPDRDEVREALEREDDRVAGD